MKPFKQYVIWGLLLLILLAACAKKTYYSRIENIDPTAQGEQYEISLQPRFMLYGLDNYSLRGFIVNVRNHSDKDLHVVWKDTRFILNGKDQSGLVFSETDPKFKHIPKRPTAVPPDGRLRKAIYPAQYASYQTVWHHTTLPGGEVGVRLTLRVAGETITETLTLLHDTNIK
jgi:hypothetical protein